MNPFLKHILAFKLSALTIATACYFTYKFHTPIERGIDNLLYHKIPTQEGFFRDPNGIDIERTINDHGKREVYVTHKPSGLEYALGEDGFPEYSNMFKQMKKEINTQKIDPDEAKKYLENIQEIEYLLHEEIQKNHVVQQK